MTNAAVRNTEAAPPVFVGVDMAQQTFQWALHGAPDTHRASNDAHGFQTLFDALTNTVASGPGFDLLA